MPQKFIGSKVKIRRAFTHARGADEELLQKDRFVIVEKCKEKAFMIAAVAEKSRRPRIWDGALERGSRYTNCVCTRLMNDKGRSHAPFMAAQRSPSWNASSMCTAVCCGFLPTPLLRQSLDTDPLCNDDSHDYCFCILLCGVRLFCVVCA